MTLSTCPVCDYGELDEPPANFSICPCCGTQFSYDDVGRSHLWLRIDWLYAGARWWSESREPSQSWAAHLVRLRSRLDDAIWDALFATPESHAFLDELGAQAMSDYHAGRTEPLDPERL